jgi:16S rRNA (uracil1498-N3)-methyltransferase
MPRIYLPISHIKGKRLSITGDKARYLTSVLRCKKGDELIVFDGEGICLKTRIVKTDRKEAEIEVLGEFPCEADSPVNITLVQGLLKGEKMDLIIQKTTELGVKEIIPAMTERCQVRVTRKLDRWRKIAEEASRQSGRSVVPIIHAPVDLRSVFTTYSSQEKICGFIFYEEGGMSLSEATQKVRMHDTSSPRYIVIGPEGGFTSEEITLAQEKGLIVTSFGKRILRAETAAIAAVTLVQFLVGDLG